MVKILPALIGALLGRLCDTAADVTLDTDGKVHVLTQANFEGSVKKFPYTFVEFYAPWCGHCKKLEPEWEKTAQMAVTYDIPVAKVDAIAEEKLAQKHGVQSFPTLFLFKGSSSISAKYSGPRDASSMASWLGKWIEGEIVAQPDATEDGVMAWAPAAKVKVLGVLSGQAEEDKAQIKLLEAAAFMLNPAGPGSEVPVAISALPGGEMAKLGITGVRLPCVALLRTYDFEDKVVVYQDESSGLKSDAAELKNFMSWLEIRSAPVLIPATKETEKLFLKDIEAGHAIAILFGSDQSAANEIHKLAVEMTGAASKNKLKWVHAQEDDFGTSLAKNVGSTDFPDFVLWEFGETEDDDRVFKLSQQEGYSSFPTKDLGQIAGAFIEKWTAGELSVEPDPVITLTSESFEDVVFKQPKDVLVEFYAPWCGHCKALAPEYKELAKHYASDEGITIAKMDSTQHSHSSAKISSYPTLFFYPMSNKQDPIELQFKANRDKQNMIQLVEEHRETTTYSGEAKKKKKAAPKKEPAKPPAKKESKKGKFKDVPCPDDADIFSCSRWCEESSSDTLQLIGTLGGKPCDEWAPDNSPHDQTTCTCYDDGFTDAHLTCKPECKKAKAKGGAKSGVKAIAGDEGIPDDSLHFPDDSVDDAGDATCAAGDESCRAGSAKTTTPSPDDDEDIAADF